MPLGAIAVITGASVVVPRSLASADPIADAKAQAAAISRQIQATDAQLQDLTDQYTAASYKLSQVSAAIAQTQAQLAANQSEVAKDQTQLKTQAIRQYVNSGTSSSITELFASDVNEPGVRSEYSSIAAGNITTTISHLGTARARLHASQDALAQQQAQETATRNSLQAARSQASTLVSQEQATLNGVNANIRTLIAQQQQAEEQAAQAATTAAFNASVAAAKAAQTRAPVSTSGIIPPSTGPTSTRSGGGPPSGGGGAPPPLPAGALGAVKAAESQVGVPYVWGGSSPSGFDCSGLIMWAYAQVGISLPHFSGAQYGATLHISLADLQPGDLLFYGPGGSDHEAMYVGGGSMVEATHTGDFVRIDAVRTGDGFIGAGRVVQ